MVLRMSDVTCVLRNSTEVARWGDHMPFKTSCPDNCTDKPRELERLTNEGFPQMLSLMGREGFQKRGKSHDSCKDLTRR